MSEPAHTWPWAVSVGAIAGDGQGTAGPSTSRQEQQEGQGEPLGQLCCPVPVFHPLRHWPPTPLSPSPHPL